MLRLEGVTKDYIVPGLPTVNALKGIDISFRQSEFVAILGPSGCGKTTLLNIIGGLDHATEGELFINNKSTKDYTDRDWDTYRNHKVGFIFQSYNLISHVSILRNVEMSLIIAGVPKAERRERALAALAEVGLEGLEKKKPNQLSGGQMQRVSIARAIVNDPEILLADEPTGALDTDTSIQIMDIVKEIAKTRLVVMVTHNPDLAEQYATRIVRMKDGLLTSDTDPYDDRHEVIDEESETERESHKGKKKQVSMSFATALGLSANNLWARRGRTTLVTLAGSVGIIGIALILSLSVGFNDYIDDIEEQSLSSYPLSVSTSSFSIVSAINSLIGSNSRDGYEEYPKTDVVTEASTIESIIHIYDDAVVTSDTELFKEFLELESTHEKYGEYISDIEYSYGTTINMYMNDERYYGFQSVIPTDLLKFEDDWNLTADQKAAIEQANSNWGSTFSNFTIFDELLGNYDTSKYTDQEYNQLLTEQYDVVYGEMPNAYDEVCVVIDKYNRLDDYLLIGMGIESPEYLMKALANSTYPEDPPFPDLVKPDEFTITYEELCSLEYEVPMAFRLYERIDSRANYPDIPYFTMKSGDELKDAVLNSSDTVTLKVTGVLRPKKSASVTAISGAVGYLPSLTEHVISNAINSNQVKGYENSETNVVYAQLENMDANVLNGQPLSSSYSNTANNNLLKLGYADLNHPKTIYIYAKNFSAKEALDGMFDEYTNEYIMESYLTENGLSWVSEDDPGYIEYRAEHNIVVDDLMGTMMNAVEMIVNIVVYVLIAFVAISLIVSSIMIGVITYVSVLERIKEIGILRAMGARKRDISNIFNAETFLIGIIAGLLGVAIALILDVPIMAIIAALAGTWLNFIVPWYGIVFLPIISFALTMIAGIIPASIAAKKDPVVALRSE